MFKIRKGLWKCLKRAFSFTKIGAESEYLPTHCPCPPWIEPILTHCVEGGGRTPMKEEVLVDQRAVHLVGKGEWGALVGMVSSSSSNTHTQYLVR